MHCRFVKYSWIVGTLERWISHFTSISKPIRLFRLWPAWLIHLGLSYAEIGNNKAISVQASFIIVPRNVFQVVARTDLAIYLPSVLGKAYIFYPNIYIRHCNVTYAFYLFSGILRSTWVSFEQQHAANWTATHCRTSRPSLLPHSALLSATGLSTAKYFHSPATDQRVNGDRISFEFFIIALTYNDLPFPDCSLQFFEQDAYFC